ncbi:MAG TPA: CbiX/SirB N-terminal domain-containing protein [Bacillota bacterium]|nr:CbiX/SirB N-terminal domain-containing protein [Bacillota bacterium]
MKNGIVVLGHGSKTVVDEANLALYNVVELVKSKVTDSLVEAAWMMRESGKQSLQEAIDKLVEQGAARIVVAPWFLTNGLHIQQDIPEELAEAKNRHGNKVEIAFARHLGPDPRIVDVLVDRIGEVG